MQLNNIDSLSTYKLKKLAGFLSDEICKQLETALGDRINEHLHKYVDEVMTTKQVCEMLGKSKDVIDQMCKRGKIPYHKKNGLRYFSRNELIDYFFK